MKLSITAKTVYSIIWYAGLAVAIYFLHNSIIRIIALFLVVFLTFGAFRIAAAVKEQGEDNSGEKKLAILQLFMAIAVFVLYFYLRHIGA